MTFVQQLYGKTKIRVLRLRRNGDHHEVREVSVQVMLDGNFDRAYTARDNASIVPTDTIKNLVQVLALEHVEAQNEPFALAIAQRFLDRYPQVNRVRVSLDEMSWQRLVIDGTPQAHSFVQAGGGTPFAEISVTRTSQHIVAGIRDLAIMKSTQSGFVDYIQDEFTTLPPTMDRILATRLEAAWTFAKQPADFAVTAQVLRTALLRVFATSYSYSVQDSLYRMGETALAAAPDIVEIKLTMPNIHYLPIDLSRFGLETHHQLFLPTDEPSGHIEARLRRDGPEGVMQRAEDGMEEDELYGIPDDTCARYGTR